MKILQINCVYKTGSTGKITGELHETLMKKGHHSIVCYGRGARIKERHLYKTSYEVVAKFNNLTSRFTGLLYNGSKLATMRLIHIIKKESPDIVHLQCLNGFFVNIYQLIDFLKKSGINTVLTLHAEFMYTANCGYANDCRKWETGCGNCPCLRRACNSYIFDHTRLAWNKMKEAFDGFEKIKVIGCSNWIAKRASQSPIFNNKDIMVLHNGIDTKQFHYKINSSDLRASLNIGKEKKVVLFVAPNLDNRLKGYDTFVALMKACRNKKDTVFVAVGEDHMITKEPSILYLGKIEKKKELAKVYHMADIFIMCSTIDNYPTVCLEANCCGTPVLGYDVGGVKETIYKGLGEVVQEGAFNELHMKLEAYLQNYEKPEAKLLEELLYQYSTERMCEDYINIYSKMLEGASN